MAEDGHIPVVYSEAVIADLSGLGRWIAERADPGTAESYIARVEAACERLAIYPNRGTPRFDLAPGLRTVTFERRVVLVYRVEDDCVRILRAIATSRDLRWAIGDP